MNSQIKITCPDCGKVITVKVHTIDKLEREIVRLKREIQSMRGIDYLKDIFKM